MPRVTPDQFVEKHARRLKGAVEDIRNGVAQVTESPTAKAAAKKDKMRAGINAALDSGKWEKGLRRVTLDDWKKKMVDIGIGRIAQGIDSSADKVRAFAMEALPFIGNLQEQIKKMPDVTLEDNINRMTSFVRGMSKFQRKG